MVAGVPNCRPGVALLDRDDPARVISRCAHPVLSPEAPYERVGNGLNIVFTCGALVRGKRSGCTTGPRTVAWPWHAPDSETLWSTHGRAPWTEAEANSAVDTGHTAEGQ
ncbi:MAG: hypothetical protein QN134_10600 [Armatimonadota bacterium]|nr:hypothetical protein [Armatimonadota bacterium]